MAGSKESIEEIKDRTDSLKNFNMDLFNLNGKIVIVNGEIINIASMSSYFGGKYVPSYIASKHDVVGLTKALASKASVWNVQVNAIAPGYIETANTAQIRAGAERNDEILNRIAAGHWGKTNELMGGGVFLSSDASNYITGTAMPIDGGYLVR